GLVTDADDLQPLFVLFANALDHVRKQSPCKTMKGPAVAIIIAAHDGEFPGALVELDFYFRAVLPRKFSLGAGHGNFAPLDRDFHVVRDSDRQLANTRHDANRRFVDPRLVSPGKTAAIGRLTKLRPAPRRRGCAAGLRGR